MDGNKKPREKTIALEPYYKVVEITRLTGPKEGAPSAIPALARFFYDMAVEQLVEERKRKKEAALAEECKPEAAKPPKRSKKRQPRPAK
ncbi:unnamed protein product [Gemmata massiliana]|uniref:Uncharacterized protein n=1 Tax=Gemmata massiliana TaxID=1210884 RepID=A0A6P2D5H9_9BACT|nr:hypothetical protein [Gemmata massiliana]VTR96147.1 unnamed protein product [Gemmata massiliana]